MRRTPREGLELTRLLPGLFLGILLWLLIGGIVFAGCKSPPITVDPPPPCKEPSAEVTAQIRGLPPGTPLVYFLDEIARDCGARQ